MKRLYFFWVCPDTYAFEWFADLLRTIEDQVGGAHYIECIFYQSILLLQLQSKGINDFLEYHIYLTRGWNPSDVSVTIYSPSDVSVTVYNPSDVSVTIYNPLDMNIIYIHFNGQVE